MYNMVHLYCRCDIVFDCRLVEVNNDCNNVHVWANVHRSFNLLNDSIFVPPATIYLLHCVLASCGAVYCNRSCLWVCDSGRCLNLTTASACTVFASLWVLFASFQVSAGHVRPSHIRCCWTKDMELVLWQFAWTWQWHFVARWRHSSLNNTQHIEHTRGVRLAMMHCINWHNNNTSICKAHNVSIRAESEALTCQPFPFQHNSPFLLLFHHSDRTLLSDWFRPTFDTGAKSRNFSTSKCTWQLACVWIC